MLDCGSEGSFREVCSSNICVVGQGRIDNQLEFRSGNRCLSCGRHEEMDVFTFLRLSLREGSWGKKNKGSGYKLMGERRMQQHKETPVQYLTYTVGAVYREWLRHRWEWGVLYCTVLYGTTYDRAALAPDPVRLTEKWRTGRSGRQPRRGMISMFHCFDVGSEGRRAK